MDGDEDMDSDDRVVEYRERGEKCGSSCPPGAALRSRVERSPSPWSESDEMDYDLELKMISTPSPKKSKKMTMYADEVESQLKSIRSVNVGQKKSVEADFFTSFSKTMLEFDQPFTKHIVGLFC